MEHLCITKEELRSIIFESVKEAVKHNECACNLTKEDRKEMSHLVGMIRDVGDGDLSKGIETTRISIRLAGTIKHLVDKVSMTIIVTIVVALVGAFMTVVGLKTLK